MDAKKVMERLKGEADRKSMTLYLSESVFSEFKTKCGKVSPSKVLEELMKDFIESSKSGKPIKKRPIKKS